MNVLFYDENEKRMQENYEYFIGLEDAVFIAVKNIALINEISSSVDFVVLYDSERIKTGEYIKGNIYFISAANDTEAMMKSFSLGARHIEGELKTKALYEFLLGEYSESVKRIRQSALMIEYVMRKSCIPRHLKGYDYLTAAINICCGDNDMSYGVTKVLYPLLSKQFSTTPCNVERSIRNAIEQGWDSRNEFYQKLFSPMPNRRPSNRTFLKAAVEYIHLNYTK